MHIDECYGYRIYCQDELRSIVSTAFKTLCLSLPCLKGLVQLKLPTLDGRFGDIDEYDNDGAGSDDSTGIKMKHIDEKRGMLEMIGPSPRSGRRQTFLTPLPLSLPSPLPLSPPALSSLLSPPSLSLLSRSSPLTPPSPLFCSLPLSFPSLPHPLCRQVTCHGNPASPRFVLAERQPVGPNETGVLNTLLRSKVDAHP